jgi:hypothetical protein
MQQAIEQPAAVVAVAAPSFALLFQIWPFGLAFMAGFIALIYLARMPIDQAIKSIIGSTFLGGSLAQLTAEPLIAIIVHLRPELFNWAQTAQIPVVALIAILIGLTAQQFLPKLMNRGGRFIDNDKKDQ